VPIGANLKVSMAVDRIPRLPCKSVKVPYHQAFLVDARPLNEWGQVSPACDFVLQARVDFIFLAPPKTGRFFHNFQL